MYVRRHPVQSLTCSLTYCMHMMWTKAVFVWTSFMSFQQSFLFVCIFHMSCLLVSHDLYYQCFFFLLSTCVSVFISYKIGFWLSLLFCLFCAHLFSLFLSAWYLTCVKTDCCCWWWWWNHHQYYCKVNCELWCHCYSRNIYLFLLMIFMAGRHAGSRRFKEGQSY